MLVVGELDQLGFARGQIRIPILIARGAREGPMLVLVAGQHPGEYVGMNAVVELATTMDLQRLTGSVVGVPILNPYGVRAKTPYICPFDGLNMNRQWPGTYGGTVSARTAYAVWHNVIERADYFIDLHGGDFPELQADYAICFETGNEKADAISRRMARHFGARYVRTSSLTEGGQKTGGSARMAMQIRGIPSIVTEVGDAGKVDPERLKQNVSGIRNVMRLLGMLAEETTSPPEDQREMVGRTPVLATRSGLCHLLVRIGQSVEAEQPLAEIRDPFGQILETVVSPVTGDVVQMFYQGWLNEGEIVAKVASLARMPKEDTR
jgi:hypothetical protein